MLELEAEVFVHIGAWKSIEDLEENLTLVELDLFLKTIHENKKETNVFLAAIQGIDLNKHYSNPVKDKIKEIEQRAAMQAAGGETEYERQEFAELGISFEDD